jgi:hypothetical protein
MDHYDIACRGFQVSSRLGSLLRTPQDVSVDITRALDPETAWDPALVVRVVIPNSVAYVDFVWLGKVCELNCVVSCRVVSCRVVSCRVVSCRVVSCRVVSCRVVSCRVVSYRIVSYRIVSYRIVSYRIISYRIVPIMSHGVSAMSCGAVCSHRLTCTKVQYNLLMRVLSDNFGSKPEYHESQFAVCAVLPEPAWVPDTARFSCTRCKSLFNFATRRVSHSSAASVACMW